MTRVFHLFYYYLLVLMVLFTAYMTIMLALSPKQDEQKRGFISCTEQLVISVSSCERGKIFCTLKYLWGDMKCNTVVILGGLGAWIRGQQITPWANYLYEPVVLNDDGVEYEGDIKADMADLEAQSQFIQLKKQELEDVKHRGLNLREDVLMSAPEEVHPNDVDEVVMQLPLQEDVEQGDISEEAFMEKMEDKKDE